jgi:acyl-CoA synthetase (AMP-forming)/AMP-acid ligase II
MTTGCNTRSVSERAPSPIGRITLGTKPAGERRTGNLYAPFERAGAGDGRFAYRASPRPYYLWFQACADDMIIFAGYNISGPEVENVLLGHPLVRECAVIGAPDPERGMIVKAYVVPRDPRQATPETAGAAGLRQGRDRALQVPGRRRLPRRVAAHRDRQGPALQAAGAEPCRLNPARAGARSC